MTGSPLAEYRAKRDFTRTREPSPGAAGAASTGPAPIFIVQKHAAHRAGLHWDFRLEHGGVLWSWAVPKGPSLDPAERRMAIHVEDHPLDYAGFQGTIPEGSYGAGSVESWDRGTWTPIGDPEEGMRAGHLRFILHGGRLNGRFTLARLGNRAGRRAEGWFLIKGEDEWAQPGVHAAALERAAPAPAPGPGWPPPGARRGPLPRRPAPELCTPVPRAPGGEGWLTEIKFDGYRILIRKEGEEVRILTRNGLDWTDRLGPLAEAARDLGAQSLLLDGELVALGPDGTSRFPLLQAALSEGRIGGLVYYAFDLLHRDGWDLRPAALRVRKDALRSLLPPHPMLRFSDHVEDSPDRVFPRACAMRLEGVICKRADSPYREGRRGDWLKVKCQGRDEFVVLGWTPPRGSRVGFGALHVGFHDPQGRLHYAGGVGSGYDTAALAAIRARLEGLEGGRPDLLWAGARPPSSIRWVRPELVIEAQYTGWSGAGRMRHPVFVGLREDKRPEEVVMAVPDPEAGRSAGGGTADGGAAGASRRTVAVPPRPAPTLAAADGPAAAGARIVTARAPGKRQTLVGGVAITHPDRVLWPATDAHPALTKQDLAAYWTQVAAAALPGLVRRPLAIVRCPDGIGGERFFQKNGHGHLPPQIREGRAGNQPYLAIDDEAGLLALAQMSAIELHPWGASEADPAHPDRLVFDLDPGEGVPFAAVAAAAREVRERLRRLGLESLCRTSGGKGLHVVVPLRPEAGWDRVKPFCRAFAETMAQDSPDKYVAHVKIADRKGRILVDWLRNGLGATAVASFCPRARAGAGVATPLAWREVTAKLDPAAFDLVTVPRRLARQKTDPWAEAAGWDQRLPTLTSPPPAPAPAGRARIVTARRRS